MSGASPARWARAAPRRRSGPRPELFPVRDDPRAARFPALPARRPAQGGGARGRPRAAARRRRQARQPGHLLRPGRRLCRGRRKVRPEAAKGGDIVDRDGRVLGRHRGLIHFTVGQRRGLEIGGQPEPLYVLRLEPQSRRVVVGPKTRWRVRAGSRGSTGSARTSATRLPSRSARWRGRRPRVDGESASLRPARIWRRARPGGGPLLGDAGARRRLDRGDGSGGGGALQPA